MRPNNAIAVAKLDKARSNGTQTVPVKPTNKESEKTTNEKTNVDESAIYQNGNKGRTGIKRVRRKSASGSSPSSKTHNVQCQCSMNRDIIHEPTLLFIGYNQTEGVETCYIFLCFRL